MKLIAETFDVRYCLQVKLEDGTVLATASEPPGGGGPPRVFYIWEEEGPDDECDTPHEGVVQTHRVGPGDDPQAVWDIVQFHTYQVAMDVWKKQREQEAREDGFMKLVVQCQEEYLPALDRMLSTHFDRQAEDIDSVVLSEMKRIYGYIKQAYQMAELLNDPPG